MREIRAKLEGKADASEVLRHVLDMPAVVAELEATAMGGAK